MVNVQFFVVEMSCAACSVSVEKTLKKEKGVHHAIVNYASQKAIVEIDETLTNAETLRKAVQAAGYDLITDRAATDKIRENQLKQLKYRVWWTLCGALLVAAWSMVWMDWAYSNWLSLLVTGLVVFVAGKDFFISSWKKIKRRETNMDTLIALSTGTAFFYSAFNTVYPSFLEARGIEPQVYFEAAAFIIAFISLGKWIEEKAKANASSAIKKLMALQPQSVSRVNGTDIEECPLEQVVVGDIILVKPGQKIPIDGEVLNGQSYVDESLISGEAIPVEKTPGSKVFSGTINQKGSFQFRCEKVGSDTLLAHIIEMVEHAQNSKAPVQKLVDKVSSIFVWVVIVISILTFSSWLIFGGLTSLPLALVTSISVLVIACPCALGLATPTGLMVGLGVSAAHNIFIRDAESIEKARRINTLIFDKTGTLTKGYPQVENFIEEELSEDEKGILFAIEKHSDHPLAGAIISYLSANPPPLVPIHAVKNSTGKGIEAEYKNQKYYVGNVGLVKEMNLDISPYIATLKRLDEDAQSIVFFFSPTKVKAIIGIADTLKSNVPNVIHQLEQDGIEVMMLTGDRQQAADAIATQAGIRSYSYNLLPNQKGEIIQSLQSQNKTVAMIGDGINDAEALALADVGIAMGKGSDIAIDVAHITLMTSDLSVLPKTILLSKKIVKIIRQNLFWAFIYNSIGIPIAAGVLYPLTGFLLNPMVAGGAMALSSVCVVANSLRLKWVKL